MIVVDRSSDDMWGGIVGIEPVAKPRVTFADVAAGLPNRKPSQTPALFDDEFGFGGPVFTESAYG